jgi:hypothetical protein
MAGCLLSFVNNSETVAMRGESSFSRLQEGAVGDMTASRKVRLPGVPIEEFLEMTRRGEKPPERLANSLYLEWFSDANGRVVLESTGCEVSLSTPLWRLAEDEEPPAAGSADALDDVAREAVQALEFSFPPVPPEREGGEELDPEKVHKLAELMEKYRDHPDCDRIIAREMGWDHIIEMMDAQEADADQDDDEDADRASEAGDGGASESGAGTSSASDWGGEDEKTPGPDPNTEGREWLRTEDGDIKHPLSHRASESAAFLVRRASDLGLAPDEDEDLGALLGNFEKLGTKLAAALDGWARNPGVGDPVRHSTRLKRGLTPLHAAQAALERIGVKKILPAEDMQRIGAELFGIREEMLRIAGEFRKLS